MASKTSDVQTQTLVYQPTPEERKAAHLIYKYLQEMIMLKNRQFPQFSGPRGDRSWLQMVDDSEALLNGYTQSRDAQGKEEWQSNLMDNISRVKMRAIAAGVGLKMPEMDFTATNGSGIMSSQRAEIFKNITQQTFKDGNPALHSYKEVWHMLAHGVIFEYEGFKTGGAVRDVIESFDSVTGEVKTKKEYVPGSGKPFSVILNPQEFYWWDMFTDNIQDQSRIAWVQHYTKTQCEEEFGKYKNFKYVKDKKTSGMYLSQQQSSFFLKWMEHVEDVDDYEVVRMYSKSDNSSDGSPLYGYEVWINGVPMLRVPLLWGQKEPMYPFAKQIAEPYANTNFFVGLPFGQIMEAYQEGKNTILNTMIDKLYRSMEKPMLVGLQNQDILDFEGQFVNQDNRFYVPDINQVKPFPYEGINAGEMNMLAIFDRSIQSLSVDASQQGQAVGGGKTAREVLIANQRAQELKSALYLSLEDLWYQKTKLRVEIVLTHYLEDKAAQKETKDQIIQVPDYTFGDGARGILAIHIAKKPSQIMSQQEVEARAQAMEQQGIPYMLISIPQTYIDDWQVDFSIVPKSLQAAERLDTEAELMAEIEALAKLNPSFVAANLDEYTKEILALRGKRPDQFKSPNTAPPSQDNKQKVAVSLNYKDAPDNVKRAIESDIGVNPAPTGSPIPPAPGGAQTAPTPILGLH